MPAASSNTVYIAFGANKGDVKKNIAAAVAGLEAFGSVEKISPLFITEPEGFKGQPDFTNGALEFKTALAPQDLLRALKDIETRLGRGPAPANGPREIDLDIIFYNSQTVQTPRLTIPHPRAHEREFVLLPLSFIAPDFTHPITGLSVGQMLRAVIRAKYPAHNSAYVKN
ncbi:MAG: 2-amino-4-hydroxy-6-hydroxymethyldihydropteridine diphosphokinase [Elusimicrobiota bacterium]|jgi:2-amino-4-hydroxy-6-hydroxymethyldihydropteridine diphosphokinase|nr:2-amino-4-hydroxy-6-hydroxymethyldihydropteridine diphosphokinase [Elusimicrobiota bacterium]